VREREREKERKREKERNNRGKSIVARFEGRRSFDER
jgi:hypothetical protein